MTGSQNWAVPRDAGGYLQAQAKRQAINDRKVPSRVSDVVGPGIKSQAVPLDDCDDPLGLFNGVYSCAPGTPNAPDGTSTFIVESLIDADAGGFQIAYALETESIYTRSVIRASLDPDTVVYGTWTALGGSGGGSTYQYVQIASNDIGSIPGDGSYHTAQLGAPLVYSLGNGLSTMWDSSHPDRLLIPGPGIYRARFSINLYTDTPRVTVYASIGSAGSSDLGSSNGTEGTVGTGTSGTSEALNLREEAIFTFTGASYISVSISFSATGSSIVDGAWEFSLEQLA